MTEVHEAARPLLELQPRHDFFVGIDSDGCAFDTMEIKHKECFTPNTIKHWSLQPVSKYAREAALFVNLYSKWRGINRWPALVMVFDLLRERPEVQARNVVPPEASRIRQFIADDGFPKSNDGLKAYMAEHPDPELDTALAWTSGINATVADMVHGVPPFPYVRESLTFLADKADMIVVSATPVEALTREWEEHGIAKYVRVIAGQERGSKTEHLKLAAGPTTHCFSLSTRATRRRPGSDSTRKRCKSSWRASTPASMKRRSSPSLRSCCRKCRRGSGEGSQQISNGLSDGRWKRLRRGLSL
jgi:hypothetical protein